MHGDFAIIQRPAEFGGAVLDFGPEIGLQLGGDVVALRFREPEFYGSEVAIE